MPNKISQVSIRRIEADRSRFRDIVRGRIRRDLRKYISQGELLARKGKDVVSVPMPQIEVPRFRFSDEETGGVGQGEGEEGDPMGQGEGSGEGEAGDQPGEHVLEVDVTLDELARIMGEELELPRIEPRGSKDIRTARNRYKSIRRVGPQSLVHFKRTYKEALKRQIAAGEYDPENPMVIPNKADKRYRSFTPEQLPDSNAVIIYMMDVSGSMGSEQKEIVRIEAFWIDTWLKSQYKNLETRYIVHDAMAKEVDEHTFFHLKESGGTKISSAFDLCKKIMDVDYPVQEWNIYPFHFSDGDNWGGDDTKYCLKLLTEDILPVSNVFCYGQVKSAYGSGQFKKSLDEAFPDDERIITSEIKDRDAIFGSIKEFLGKGK